MMVIEGSLPKAATGSNRRALDQEEALAYIYDRVFAEVADLVDPPEPSDVRLSRLDTVTDLDCPEPAVQDVLRGYSEAAVRKDVRREVYTKGSRCTGVVARNKTTRLVRVYDNAFHKQDIELEANFGYPEGSIRVEAEHKQKRLQKYELRTLADWGTDIERVPAMHMEVVEWAGLTTETVREEDWVDRVIQHYRGRVSETTIRNFIGWYVCYLRGLEGPVSRSTLSNFRRMAKQMRLQPTLTREGFRLDFATGRVCTSRDLLAPVFTIEAGRTHMTTLPVFRDERGHYLVEMFSGDPEINELLMDSA